MTLHVQPHARSSAVAGLHGDALKLKIDAPAADGKANAKLIAYLSGILDVPRGTIAILHGATSRRKVVEIAGGPEIAARVQALVAARDRGSE